MQKYEPPMRTELRHPLLRENVFLKMKPEATALPKFPGSRAKLPQPSWQGHPDVIACYWKAWELAFRNLHRPKKGSGFVSNFIDTAFNQHIFMWDSSFIVMFGRYGARVFNFQKTLDNFYSCQHPNGFISRELQLNTGSEQFDAYDPSSTGPNLLPWAEWEYFLNTGNRTRLAQVFPPLLAFYDWFRAYRTWPDGTYFSTGWGCGMDNQPRISMSGPWLPYQDDYSLPAWSHNHMTWVDTTLQQIFAGRLLIRMAGVLGREQDVREIRAENRRLSRFVDTVLWNPRTAFYHDRLADGSLSSVKSIAAFWALLAGVGTPAQRRSLIAHLRNPREFARLHPVPSLSADHPKYEARGSYWLGGVWPPTNYMVLRGLTASGEDELAHAIGRKHVEHVAHVCAKTGTVWENYAPDHPEHGDFHCARDFVGWTGISPITILFEYVFGLRPDVPAGKLVWDIRLTDAHGVKQYPFGKAGLLSLTCAAREKPTDPPVVTVHSTVPLTLELRWTGGKKRVRLG